MSYGNGNGGYHSDGIDSFYPRVLRVHETLNHYKPAAPMKMKNTMKDKVCMPCSKPQSCVQSKKHASRCAHMVNCHNEPPLKSIQFCKAKIPLSIENIS